MKFWSTKAGFAGRVARRKFVFTLATLLIFNSCVSRSEPQEFSRTDVDADGIDETFEYNLTKDGDAYIGQLKITRSNGDILWDHKWKMRTEDLHELIETEGVSLDKWRELYFSGKLYYGVHIGRRKLLENDINRDRLDKFCERNDLDPESILSQILEQESSYIFVYRASWREDVILLVYVQKERRFVLYDAGY